MSNTYDRLMETSVKVDVNYEPTKKNVSFLAVCFFFFVGYV